MKKETNAYILETITNFYTQILFRYTPSEVSTIYQSRGFEVIRDILESTEDREIAKLVKGLICRLASKSSEIEILQKWKNGTYPAFDHPEKKPSIDQQWRIVYKMHSLESLSKDELKKAMDLIEDPTDSRKEWTARIESFSKDSPQERAELYKSLVSKDCSHSYTMMSQYCLGLNSSQLPIEKRSSYFA